MANARLKKQDKLVAIHAMVRDKYQDQFTKLNQRRIALLERVYRDAFGAIPGNLAAVINTATKAEAGNKREPCKMWFEYRNELALVGVSRPGLLVEPTMKLRFSAFDYELFRGKQGYTPLADDEPETLTSSVIWPRGLYTHHLSIEDAYADTKKVAATLDAAVLRFNAAAREFYDQAYDVVMYQINTTKQVDARFPELWKYLPAGLREQVKQGMVPFDQSVVDNLREQLPLKG